MVLADIYENTLRKMSEDFSNVDSYSDFLVYESRLLDVISDWRKYGEDSSLKRERSKIIDSINRLALENKRRTFNDYRRVELEKGYTRQQIEDYEQIYSIIMGQVPKNNEIDLDHRSDAELRIIRSILDKLSGRVDKMDSVHDIYFQNHMNHIHFAPPRLDFIGRETYINKALDSLGSLDQGCLISIQGAPGVGKSSLAIEVAYQLVENDLFTRVFWISGQPRYLDLSDIHRVDNIAHIDWEYILDTIISALALHPGKSLIEKERLVQAHLSKERCLLIIDNFETISDSSIVHSLKYKIPSPSKVLVTSRHRVHNADTMIVVDTFSMEEASVFIRKKAQQKNMQSLVNAERDVLEKIWKWSSGLPLAIHWLIGYISESALDVKRVMEDLESKEVNREILLEFLFGETFTSLDEITKQVLQAATVFYSHSDYDSLLASCGISEDAFKKSIRHVHRVSLLEYDDISQQYKLLPITKEFLTDNLNEPEILSDFRSRLGLYYVEWLNNIDYRLGKSHPVWKELLSEKENILDIFDWAYNTSRWELVLGIGEKFSSLLGSLGYYDERLRCAKYLVEAAKETNERDKEVWFMIYDLAWVEQNIGNRAQARESLLSASNLAREINNHKASVLALRNIALIDYREALIHEDHSMRDSLIMSAMQGCEEALNILDTHLRDDLHLKSLVLRTTAHVYFESGRLDMAKKYYQEVIDTHETMKKPDLSGLTFSDLGVVALAENDIVLAKSYFDRSLQIADKHSNRFLVARNEQRIAYLYAIISDWSASKRHFNSAMSIYKEIGAISAIEDAQAEIQQIELQKTPKLTV
jgi:tetratricopeptide (TPR) repeat protein